MRRMSEWWWERKGSEPVKNIVDLPPEATWKVLEHYGAEVPEHEQEWVHFRCPFHDDSRASASLSRSGYFECHGCGIKGRAVRLVMEQEQLPRTKAVEWISTLM